LEVIAPIPTTFRHCLHCEQVMDAQIGTQVRLEMAREYPPEFLEAFDRLMAWIDEVVARFGPDLQVRVVDPQSPEGLWKCLRYGVRRYPAFIVQRRRRAVGWDREALEQVLEEARAAL
jgi:hypothetical protein